MLVQRVLSAIVLVPLILVVVWVGGLWFLAVAMAVSLLATWEFYSLLRRAGFTPLWPFGVVLTPVFVLDGFLQDTRASTYTLAISLALSLLYLLARQKLDGSLLDWSVTWLPPLYAGLLLSFIVALRQLPFGDRWMYLVLAITWATDTGAYSVGRLFGRHQFFPRISPRKTLEGAAGGGACGVLAGVLLAWLFGWDLARIAPLVVLATIAAELGDLAESFIKRQLRTKDASHLIPGHGGMLDRLDSAIFVAMAAYFWAIWIGGAA